MNIRNALYLIPFVLVSCLDEESGVDVGEEIEPVPFISFINSQKVTVTNSGNYRHVELLINGKKFYSSFADIVDGSILTASRSQNFKILGMDSVLTRLDTAISIWYNIGMRTEHNTPISQKIWLHHPILFLNSVGNGICDDVANINESIWAYLGYRSRTWYLEGHVVSEVFIDDRWVMLDSDVGIYFLNDTIFSVQDLFEHPDSFYEPDLKRQMIHKTWDWHTDDWEHLINIYRNGQGLIDRSKPEVDSANYSYSIPLPPGAELIFGKNLVDSPVTFEFDDPNYFNLILKSSHIDSLSLKLFLYPIEMSGRGQVWINEEPYSIEECDRAFFVERFNSINSWNSAKSVIIKDATDFEIVFMVNGYVFDLFDINRRRTSNRFTVISDNYDGITLSKQPIN